MTEQKGLFKAFHTDCDENSLLHDIADTDKIKDLSDDELIERYNTIAAMDAEVWRRLDTPAYALEGIFAPLSSLDPSGIEEVPGKELRDAGLTHGQCAAFYNSILKPYVLQISSDFMKDIRDYKNALARELSKRELLINNGGTLWCNFGTKNDSNWLNAGEMTGKKNDDWPYRGARGVCWYCGGKLIWENDFSYEDVYGEGEGIVTYLMCSECGARVQYELRDDEEDEE